jgi:hypothetical protein
MKTKKSKVDIKKIEKALGAKSKGKIKADSGYFGALETAANRPTPKEHTAKSYDGAFVMDIKSGLTDADVKTCINELKKSHKGKNMGDNDKNYRGTGLSKEECQARVDEVIAIFKFRNPDCAVPNTLVNWVENISEGELMPGALAIPVVGECWADGKEDITILEVHGRDLALDIWIKYRYDDSGQEDENNWFAFHSRFHKKSL